MSAPRGDDEQVGPAGPDRAAPRANGEASAPAARARRRPRWLRDWRTVFDGESRAQSTRRVLLVAAALFGLSAYALGVQFVPAAWVRTAGGWAAAVLAASSALLWWRGFAAGQRGTSRARPGWDRVFRRVLYPLLVWVALWLSLVFALPDLYTRALGARVRVEASLRPVANGDPDCRWRLVGPALRTALVSWVCIGEPQLRSASSAVDVVLLGRRSALGLHVDGAEVPGAGEVLPDAGR